MIINEKHPSNERYLDKLSLAVTKEAADTADGDLEKINKLALKPVDKKDVIVYTALLIDDQVTRNHTQYPREFQNMILSLPVGEGNFVGAPVLFGNGVDHQEVASAQVGRIFDAWQVTNETGNVGVMAKLYILKEGNEDLIKKVDSGVLKELSIACKVELPICSNCMQDIRTCDHSLGENGVYAKMTGGGFCAEVSFVAVPGSDQAKILTPEQEQDYAKVVESLKEKFKTGISQVRATMDEMKALLSKEGSIVKKAAGIPTPEEVKREEIVKKMVEENEKRKKDSLASLVEITEALNKYQKVLEEREVNLKKLEESINDKPNQDIRDIMKLEAIKEAVRLGTIIDKIQITDKVTAEKFFKNLSLEEVNRIKDMFFTEGRNIFKSPKEAEKPVIPQAPKDSKDTSMRSIARQILNK